MNIHSEKTVWINVESDRYFIIPNDKVLPEGLFELKTVDRKERAVNEVDVSNYEVSEEQAQDWIQEELNKQMNLAKDAVRNAFAERKDETNTDVKELLDSDLPANLVAEVDNAIVSDNAIVPDPKTELPTSGTEVPNGTESLQNGTESSKKGTTTLATNGELSLYDTTPSASETGPLTMITSENGTFDSFDSFVEPSPAPIAAALDQASSSFAGKAISTIPQFNNEEIDSIMKESVLILNRAVSDIQLTAARAAADLQDLKEKMASRVASV